MKGEWFTVEEHDIIFGTKSEIFLLIFPFLKYHFFT